MKKNTFTLSYTDEPYTFARLSEHVEKRIKKYLRATHLFKESTTVYVKESTTWQGELCKYFLSKIFDTRVTYVETEKEADVIAAPHTLDTWESRFLEDLTSSDFSVEKERTIYPLRNVLNEEAHHIAKHIGINIDESQSTSPEGKFLDILDAKYPGIKFSLAKSIEKIEEIHNDKKRN